MDDPRAAMSSRPDSSGEYRKDPNGAGLPAPEVDWLVTTRSVGGRDASAFGLFHLTDAQRVELEDLRPGRGRHLHPETIVVVMAEGEERAVEAWKVMQAWEVPNAYLLAGGIRGWIEAQRHVCDRPRSDILPASTTSPPGPTPPRSRARPHRRDALFISHIRTGSTPLAGLYWGGAFSCANAERT